MIITATRYHDFSAGHRVAGHESKCAYLHGHNYRVHFICEAKDGDGGLDSLGRVIDFSVIKSRLCQWLEDNWDHKFLAWKDDPLIQALYKTCFPHESQTDELNLMLDDSIVWTAFNPTAENMGRYLLEVVGPRQLVGTGVDLIEVVVEETRKCSATVKKEKHD